MRQGQNEVNFEEYNFHIIVLNIFMKALDVICTGSFLFRLHFVLFLSIAIVLNEPFFIIRVIKHFKINHFGTNLTASKTC